ncbi:MAG: AAA family ATPase [Thermoplasmata archaeon]
MYQNNETSINLAMDSINQCVNEISSYYVGSNEIIKLILAAIISQGHVLLEDNPGTGKTFVAKILAKILGISYKRIQFTPDLLPSDILGTKVWRPAKGTFELVKGPIFSNLILADEINRAPPKTQAALLEAMEEKQVTIEGETIPLPEPFIVIATQNPVEYEGTYPLPEAQMDRFMVKLSLGYPEDESVLLKRRISWKVDDPSNQARVVLSNSQLLQIQNIVENSIKVSDEIIRYISSFSMIRKDKRVMAGPSGRGLISLMRMSRGVALTESRDFVIPDDVKKICEITLAHRIVLQPEYSLESYKASNIVNEYLSKLEVPK